MIVLDTNVLSETLRPAPADSVSRWMKAQPSTSIFTTTICEAEIFYGLALMPRGRRRARLERAVAAIFEEDFAERILPFDSAAARAFAPIAARRRGLGRPIASSMRRLRPLLIRAGLLSQRAMLRTSPTAG